MGKGNPRTRSQYRLESLDTPKPKRIKEDPTPMKSKFEGELCDSDGEDDSEFNLNYHCLLVVTRCLEIWKNNNPVRLLEVDTWVQILRTYLASGNVDNDLKKTINFKDLLQRVCNLFMSNELLPVTLKALVKNGIPAEQIETFIRTVDEMRASDRLDITKEYLANWTSNDSSAGTSYNPCDSIVNNKTKSECQIEVEPSSSKKMRDGLRSRVGRCIVDIEQELEVEVRSSTTTYARNTERHCKLIQTKPQFSAPIPAFPNDSTSEQSEDSNDSTESPTCPSRLHTCQGTTQKPSIGNTFRQPRKQQDLCGELKRLGIKDGEDPMVLCSRYSRYRDMPKYYLPSGPVGLLPLTDEMYNAVKEHRDRRIDPNAVVITKFDFKIKPTNLLTYGRGVWLDDVMINFYLEMIRERNNAPGSGLPQVVIYHTFIHNMWDNGKPFDEIKKHNASVDIFTFDLAFLPVHARDHWKLVVADFRNKTICCYDSVPGNKNMEFVKNFRDILAEERTARHDDDVGVAYIEEIKTWTRMSRPEYNIPHQGNGNDCGVFALLYADHLAQDKVFDFNQNHIPYFRHLMAYQTVMGTL